jgi:ubiquitin carboxyl-terminal hydrolase 25/28
MITAPTDTVQPKIDLASLALCKTDYSAVASQSPTMGATEGTSLGTIDGTAVSGPMLPPPSGNTKPTIPEGPAATNGDANSVASMDSVIGGADAEITPADSVMNDDGGAQANGMTTITTGDENDVPVAPTRPPPVPPRPEQQPEQKPTEKPVTPTKPKPKPKISSIEESARQQDAAEVMANIFDLIRCAIKGDEILREGEQGDAVKKIFFSDVTTVLEDAEGIKKNRESRNHLLVSTGQRDRSLYAVLDDDFGKDEKEDGAGTRYDYIEKAAPFQIINVKRIQFNRRQKQLVYDYSHIGLDTTMYMDRYMSETPTLGEAQLLELRQAQWAKQNELRELDERRKKLQTTGIEGMTLPDCLEAACEFVDDLRAEKEPGQDSLPTPPPELAASLHERAKYLAKDLEAIDPQIAQLESEIDTVFRDCRSVPYRLHAVFTHRGSIKGGHYWIYIYDFQNKKWRKYNDEYVEDVEEGVVLAKQEGERPQVSTGMVYIRADLVEEVTQAVCRRPEPVAVEESGDMDVDMRDIWEDEEDQVPALEPVDMGNVPVIEGVKKE